MRRGPGGAAAAFVIGGFTLVLALAGVPAMAGSSAEEAFAALVAAYEIWQAEQEPVVSVRRGDLRAAAH